MDITNKETEVWLKRIGLYKFEKFPWAQWERNPNVQVQWAHIRANKDFLTEKIEVSSELFAKVLSYLQCRFRK